MDVNSERECNMMCLKVLGIKIYLFFSGPGLVIEGRNGWTSERAYCDVMVPVIGGGYQSIPQDAPPHLHADHIVLMVSCSAIPPDPVACSFLAGLRRDGLQKARITRYVNGRMALGWCHLKGHGFRADTSGR